MKSVFAAATVVLAFSVSTNVFARAIVSIDATPLEEIQDGWSGAVNLSYSGASGNSDYAYLAASLGIQRKKDNRVNLVSFARNHGESNNAKNRDNMFAHMRHVQFYRESMAWESFVQYQSDAFRKLSDRYLIGLGLRFDVISGPVFASYGIGIMGEREELDDGTDAEYGRLASYAKHSIDISDAVKLTNSLYYQPYFEDFGDYRLTDSLTLSSKITKKLALSTSVTFHQDGRPPVGVEKIDWVYSTGLNYAF